MYSTFYPSEQQRGQVQEPTWTAQCRYNGMNKYYYITDPLKTQRLLQDLIEVFLYGYIIPTTTLNPEAKPFKPDCVQINGQKNTVTNKENKK